MCQLCEIHASSVVVGDDRPQHCDCGHDQEVVVVAHFSRSSISGAFVHYCCRFRFSWRECSIRQATPTTHHYPSLACHHPRPPHYTCALSCVLGPILPFSNQHN